MAEQQKAATIFKALGHILSNSSLQDEGPMRKEAIRLSRALTTALDEPANTATELAFAVRIRC